MVLADNKLYYGLHQFHAACQYHGIQARLTLMGIFPDLLHLLYLDW